MKFEEKMPPGKPGIEPRWTSSAKNGVGTSINPRSRIWFTLSHGIINEVYYPNIDQANIRDLGLVVTDGNNFFSEEKRDAHYETDFLTQGIPAYRLINTCKEGRYRIIKTVITDPLRDVLLQKIEFEALKGTLTDYHLYALLAPHIGNQGYENYGWAGDYKGFPMLFASRTETTLAMACSTPFQTRSCGYVGDNDAWHDLKTNYKLTRLYQKAPDGNIALTGEIDLAACNGNFVLALAFGANPDEAGQRARTALLQNFNEVLENYVLEWQTFQSSCLNLDSLPQNPKKADAKKFDLYRTSTMALKTHEAKRFPGGLIASLSIPWGNIKGDHDLGIYHLVWPRDLVESAGGLLAAGQIEVARQTVFYLMSTQEADGHWMQNMWLDGHPFRRAVQLDETALFVLLADHLRRNHTLESKMVWQTVLRAASYLVRKGPVTDEERWEEDPGYSPFTLATVIAALLAAADFADEADRPALAEYLRQTADTWNASIEHWIYVNESDFTHRLGVSGYYVRLASPGSWATGIDDKGTIKLANLPPEDDEFPASQIVSPDALALVRFGLRRPDDPRILNTIKVIDAILKTETPTGPVWHRYNHDGYGEKADGSPYDGSGIGRGWPLLAGERAHYELAAGNIKEARRLLKVMEEQAGQGGLLPEQVWDAKDIPEKGLYKGHPSHSARPLAWAHAEYIKLLRSIRDNHIFDLPPQTVNRYCKKDCFTPFAIWRFNHKIRTFQPGKILRIETLGPAEIRFSLNNWRQAQTIKTVDTGTGVFYADLPTQDLMAGGIVVFTFYWSQAGNWENRSFEVMVKRIKSLA